MGAAALRPTWCLQGTLSTLQAWKKVQRFCEPDNCLLLFGSHASNVRQPSGPVPGAAAVRVHHRPVRCSQDTCDWRTLPSTCNQHQRRRQYLGIQHVLPRTGVLALTTGLPAEAGSPYILYIYIGDQTFQQCN